MTLSAPVVVSERAMEITTRHVDPNGDISQMLCRELIEEMAILAPSIKIPEPGEVNSHRPLVLPEGCEYIIAETEATDSAEKVVAGGIVLKPITPCQILRREGHERASASSMEWVCHDPVSPDARGLPLGAVVGEIKRMFVRTQFRGAGVASRLLKQLEISAAVDHGCNMLVLETLHTWHPARRLYEKAGYTERPVYGRYDAKESICYEKWLDS